MRFPCSPDKPIPHLDVNADTGNFVYAVHQMPPGQHYMAAEYLSWVEFAATWAKVTGATIAYKEIAFDDMVNALPDRDLGVEIALMFAYSSDPGYDGGKEVLKAEDLRKVSPPTKPRTSGSRLVTTYLSVANTTTCSIRRASTAPCPPWRSPCGGWSGLACWPSEAKGVQNDLYSSSFPALFSASKLIA